MNYLDLRYSKDGGHNWSDWRKIPIGEVGDFQRRIVARRLGRGRQWVLETRVSDPVSSNLIAASIQTEGGN